MKSLVESLQDSLFVEGKEEAKKVRDMLKKLGIKPKQVSVKSSYGGYSSSVHIKINDIRNVSKDLLEYIGSNFEKYERDEYSGEILMGGNTFIFVDNNYEAENELKNDEDYKMLDKFFSDPNYADGTAFEYKGFRIIKLGGRFSMGKVGSSINMQTGGNLLGVYITITQEGDGALYSVGDSNFKKKYAKELKMLGLY